MSANFCEHPSSYAEARLFETHDRKRFEVTAISFGPDKDDPMRRRLERAFDHFVDVRGRADREVAALMREREIDIAIDVMGYTQEARPGIFAFRSAPVQALYHGYPGTLGTDWMDYLLADARRHPRRPGSALHGAHRATARHVFRARPDAQSRQPAAPR